MGVDYSALLFYGEMVSQLDGIEIDEITESEDWIDSKFEDWEVDFTDSYNGPCKRTTVIGINCKYKSLEEINEIHNKFYTLFKQRFGVEPRLILEGVVS
jgi:hypothetical protein